MNVIPNIENPQIEDILKYVRKFPCPMETETIILNEISKGNILRDIGDAGFMPDETVVMIRFKEDAKGNYSEAKVVRLQNGNTYRRLHFTDNSGAVEFRFGGW